MAQLEHKSSLRWAHYRLLVRITDSVERAFYEREAAACCWSFIAAAAQGMREGYKMPRAYWMQMQQYPVALLDDENLSRFNEVLTPILAQLKTLCFFIRDLADSLATCCCRG